MNDTSICTKNNYYRKSQICADDPYGRRCYPTEEGKEGKWPQFQGHPPLFFSCSLYRAFTICSLIAMLWKINRRSLKKWLEHLISRVSSLFMFSFKFIYSFKIGVVCPNLTICKIPLLKVIYAKEHFCPSVCFFL